MRNQLLSEQSASKDAKLADAEQRLRQQTASADKTKADAEADKQAGALAQNMERMVCFDMSPCTQPCCMQLTTPH